MAIFNMEDQRKFIENKLDVAKEIMLSLIKHDQNFNDWDVVELGFDRIFVHLKNSVTHEETIIVIKG